MADTIKCAHPSCECVVDKAGQWGKYCSEYCKKSADQIELHCNCNHQACR